MTKLCRGCADKMPDEGYDYCEDCRQSLFCEDCGCMLEDYEDVLCTDCDCFMQKNQESDDTEARY